MHRSYHLYYSLSLLFLLSLLFFIYSFFHAATVCSPDESS